MVEDRNQGKGQSRRLARQHERAGGPIGIFGEEAKKHDARAKVVMGTIVKELREKHTELIFRHRMEVSKKEINDRLASIDPSLGQVLFVEKSSVKPDGGIIEVKDRLDNYRVVLVCESKHQGNDVEKIRSGIKQGKQKDADLMVAGNAIERVHKNIQEFRNFMLDEIHFPYVVFFQGSNFATESFFVKTPDSREVKISHDAGNLNRIDRVTASSFGMKINQNYCRNAFVGLDGNIQMLQAASSYFQSEPWSVDDMASILREIAFMSIKIIFDSLPEGDE